MLKTKLFISNVANLSDARYFAAMGADYLGFAVNEYANMTVINEMIDWVEGPLFIAELEGIEWNEQLIELVDSLKVNGIAYPGFWSDGLMNTGGITFMKRNLAIQSNTDVDHQIIKLEKSFQNLSSSEIDELKAACKMKSVYLDLIFEAQDLDYIIENFNPEGLVLRGGNEEKVGLKSFDELDEIFDQLSV